MRINICLIHNYEKDRIKNIQILIKKLVNELEKKNIEITLSEVSYQNDYNAYYENFFKSFVLILRKYYILLKWYRYLKLRQMKILLLFFLIGLQILKEITKIKKLYKRFYIEDSLTRKHINALTEFRNVDEYDYLLVFESDAIFNPLQISQAIPFIKNNQVDWCVLGGEFDCKDLLLDRILSYQKNQYYITQKPVTNGTTAYLISKSFVNTLNLLEVHSSKQYKLFIPADFFLNSLFINLKKYSGKYAITIMPLVANGSNTIYKSTIRYQ